MNNSSLFNSDESHSSLNNYQTVESKDNNYEPAQQQNVPNSSQAINDELLKVFIGNNYQKITTKTLNFSGFFFTSFYMFYRKMYSYAVVLFLINLIVLNVINNNIITIIFNILVGVLFNKVYISYAKKKVLSIKDKNPQKSMEELKRICSSKGGTSVFGVVIGLIIEIIISTVVLVVTSTTDIYAQLAEVLNFNNWNIKPNNNTTESTKVLENVQIDGYSCYNSKCTISIKDESGIAKEYILGENVELLKKLEEYNDYIKINIYYTPQGFEDDIIEDYKIFLKSNNEDISGIKDENELRKKIGLYTIGTHTDTFTLVEIGSVGFGLEDDETFSYTTYIFADNNETEYEMQYKNTNGILSLIEGEEYEVTFEVKEGTFGFEFAIKSIE